MYSHPIIGHHKTPAWKTLQVRINCSSIIYASYHQYLEFYQSMTLGHEVLEQITKVPGLNM